MLEHLELPRAQAVPIEGARDLQQQADTGLVDGAECGKGVAGRFEFERCGVGVAEVAIRRAEQLARARSFVRRLELEPDSNAWRSAPSLPAHRRLRVPSAPLACAASAVSGPRSWRNRDRLQLIAGGDRSFEVVARDHDLDVCRQESGTRGRLDRSGFRSAGSLRRPSACSPARAVAARAPVADRARARSPPDMQPRPRRSRREDGAISACTYAPSPAAAGFSPRRQRSPARVLPPPRLVHARRCMICARWTRHRPVNATRSGWRSHQLGQRRRPLPCAAQVVASSQRGSRRSRRCL